MGTTKESANQGIAVTVQNDRTATMVQAILTIDGIAPTVQAALTVAADVYRNRPSNLSPNLAVATFAARRSGASGMAYDGSGNVLFGANRNRDGSVLNVAAEPHLIVRANGKGWHSRVANVQQDFPNGLKGNVEAQYVSFLAAVLSGESDGKRFAAVRQAIDAGANEDYAIRSAFLAAIRSPQT